MIVTRQFQLLNHDQLVQRARDLSSRGSHTQNLSAAMTDHYQHRSPLFLEFLDQLKITVDLWLAEWRPGCDHRWSVENLWQAVYAPGDHCDLHDHWPYQISWVYWLAAGGHEPLEFPDHQCSVPAVSGKLAVFPGWWSHRVAAVRSERVIIAGNCRVDLV